MKVKLKDTFKPFVTASELDIIKEIIKDLKDGDSEEDYVYKVLEAVYACSSISTIVFYNSDAEIAKNERVTDYFGENSGHLDVWINSTVLVNDKEFIILGFYLSDAMNLNSFSFNYEEFISHMIIRKFREI